MNLVLIRIFGVLILIGFAEFKVMHFFRGADVEVLYQLGNLWVWLLIVPCIAFIFLPLERLLSKSISCRPVFIKIENNKINVRSFGGEVAFFEYVGAFSQGDEFISAPEKLTETVSQALRDCAKSGRFYLAPYVVFSASGSLSEVQRADAESAILAAGASKAKYIENVTSDDDIWRLVQQNPVGLFQ
ncbi:TPA: hypothetical protein I8273_004808 [Aeromonas hydrophila]|nr:hypothetical protein [Aeromonas hydrophila]HAT2639255.1 hypothetical protein [Aeromonas hydrophila]HAT3424504.1 hypothetical protein [Aeromonas hydrophila]HAT3534430.1 hypothetical protein [Aeromonas hydrophila]